MKKEDIMKNKILVVEDDLKIQELIVEFLSSQNYEVYSSNDGVQGYENFKTRAYDLVILDVMMPLLDGYSLCKMIRQSNKDVPIIFLTALGSEEDEVKGFEAEGDDYITKPFSFNVLIKRVEAALKRKQVFKKATSKREFNNLTLDLSTYKVYTKGKEVELTLKEFNILKMLVESYPKVVTRERLIAEAWGYDYYGDTRVIDAHVKNIRKKIEENYIKTVKGIGYVLEREME